MSARLLLRVATISLWALSACSSPESPHETAADTAAAPAVDEVATRSGVPSLDEATPSPGAPALDGVADLTADPGTAAAPLASPSPGNAAAPAATTAGPKPYRDDIPLAPPGKGRRASILDGKADAARVDDPEADAVARGRRTVAPIADLELADGFDSAEALAEAVLDRASWNDFDALLGLRVSRPEFDRLFWPEFPQSRPATGIRAGDAWAFHDAACRDGVTAILSAYGGIELHFVGVRFEVGFTPYTNFNLYRGAVIQAVNDRGDPIEIRAAADFAERHGKWRIYLFDS